MPDKIRRFTLAAVLIVFVACFILAEAGIRIYHLTNDRQRFIWLPDQFLGYVHSVKNVFQHHYSEGAGVTVNHKTNRFGLIGEEVPLEKAQGTLRVLVLGDSYTEAFQVPAEMNFCGLLQAQLNNASGKKYSRTEVLNAGVSGYSPLNYYLAYKREWARFKPDIVLVQLFANDVFEDNTATAKSVLDENGLPLCTGRYFSEEVAEHPRVERRLFNEYPLGYRIRRRLIEISRFFEYMYVKIYNWQKASAYHQKMIRVDEYGTGYQFFILDPEHVLSRDEVFRRKAWGYTQQYLLALKREVELTGARMALFYVPMEAQLELEMYGEHASLYVSKHLGTSFNDLLAGFSRQNHIPFLDLLGDFETHKAEGLYLSRDGHLTQQGHAVAARALYLFLLREDNHPLQHRVLTPGVEVGEKLVGSEAHQ